jgi:hypothetical protein
VKRWCVIAALVVFPAVAKADAVSDADARFKEGVALQRAGNVDGAREKFLQSLALHRSASTLINLAILEADAKHPDRALGYLREWLKHPGADVAKKAKVEREMLPVLEAETGRAEVKAPPGQEVKIDGRSHGNAPIREVVDLMPGSHEVSCAGKVVTITVRNGQVTSVDVTDGTKGQGPVTPPPETERGSWVVPGMLGGLGVVGIGVGIGLGAASGGADSDAKAQIGACTTGNPSGCSALRAADNKISATGVPSIIAYAGGGVLLGAAVVAALIEQPWRERPVRRVTVVPGLGGASVVGSF